MKMIKLVDGVSIREILKRTKDGRTLFEITQRRKSNRSGHVIREK